jgi:hypothetical protein
MVFAVELPKESEKIIEIHDGVICSSVNSWEIRFLEGKIEREEIFCQKERLETQSLLSTNFSQIAVFCGRTEIGWSGPIFAQKINKIITEFGGSWDRHRFDGSSKKWNSED